MKGEQPKESMKVAGQYAQGPIRQTEDGNQFVEMELPNGEVAPVFGDWESYGNPDQEGRIEELDYRIYPLGDGTYALDAGEMESEMMRQEGKDFGRQAQGGPGASPMEDFLEKVMQRKSSLGAQPLNHYIQEEDIEFGLEAPLDNQGGYWWFIPRSVVLKKTAKGKHYYVLKVIDSTNNLNTLRVWGASTFYFEDGERVEKLREIFENKPYCVTNLKYDPTWGFSIHGAFKCLKLLDG